MSDISFVSWRYLCHHLGMTFAPRVQFPVVFPRAGDYRLFVQIKRNERVETAAFDLQVR